jgi:hypothetical protein
VKSRPYPAASGSVDCTNAKTNFETNADAQWDFGIDPIKALNTLLTDSAVVNT